VKIINGISKMYRKPMKSVTRNKEDTNSVACCNQTNISSLT